MFETEIKSVCKNMMTYQMHFPCRPPSTLNYSESVGGGGAMVGGERQCPERSAATVKLLPTAGGNISSWLHLALRSEPELRQPGVATRSRLGWFRTRWKG